MGLIRIRRTALTIETIHHEGGPRPDDIVFALAMATGGRIHARRGGLALDDIQVHDGQR